MKYQISGHYSPGRWRVRVWRPGFPFFVAPRKMSKTGATEAEEAWGGGVRLWCWLAAWGRTASGGGAGVRCAASTRGRRANSWGRAMGWALLISWAFCNDLAMLIRITRHLTRDLLIQWFIRDLIHRLNDWELVMTWHAEVSALGHNFIERRDVTMLIYYSLHPLKCLISNSSYAPAPPISIFIRGFITSEFSPFVISIWGFTTSEQGLQNRQKPCGYRAYHGVR